MEESIKASKLVQTNGFPPFIHLRAPPYLIHPIHVRLTSYMYTSAPIISAIIRDIYIYNEPNRSRHHRNLTGFLSGRTFLFVRLDVRRLDKNIFGCFCFLNVSRGGAGPAPASCDFWLTSMSTPKHTTPCLANILAYHLHPALALIADCVFCSTVGPETSPWKRRVSVFDRYRATSARGRPAGRPSCKAVV